MRIKCAPFVPRVMLGAGAILPGLCGQTPKPANAATDGSMYNHDSADTRYSPLNQIDTANVAKLTQPWTFTTATAAPAAAPGRSGAGIGAEVTPIAINGIMYVPAANLVAAFDTDGGKEVWRYQSAPGQASTRGVSYWPGDKENPPRIIFTSGNAQVGWTEKKKPGVPYAFDERGSDLLYTRAT